jgi:translocation and assembly module TamA
MRLGVRKGADHHTEKGMDLLGIKAPDIIGGAKWKLNKSAAALLLIMTLMLCLARPSGAAPVEIVIVGLEGDVLKNVQAALALPPGLVRDGRVDGFWLDRFAAQSRQNVLKALEPFGYYRARVQAAIERPGEGKYLLRVEVSPGEAVRVTEVHVAVRGAGSQEKALQGMAAAFPLKKGDVLLQPLYDRAKGALQSRAQELGYRDADFSVHEIRIDETLSTARIELILETGDAYRFGGVTIKGAPDYPDAFLRRYLAFREGDLFLPAKLAETQRNYRNSERFREINIMPGNGPQPENAVPVTVELGQAPTESLRAGLGYGTDTGARFSTRYRDLNLFHRGHEFSANLFVSERLQGLASAYVIPSLKDVKNYTSVQVNLQQEDTDAYRSRLASAELAWNRGIGATMLGTAYFRLLYEKGTIGNEDASYYSALPGLRLTDDRYDNPSHPRRGFRYAAEVRGTHSWLGSDMGLLQGIFEGSRLTPLPWGLTLHTRSALGLTLLSDPLRDLPPSLRFFAGGDQSVRGYAYKSLAPRDAEGNLLGGKHLLSASAELERAIFEDWSVSVFYDAGNAFDSLSSFRLYQGAGLGLHYYTPVGALNLSVARQVGKEDPSWRIHFTVGFQL